MNSHLYSTDISRFVSYFNLQIEHEKTNTICTGSPLFAPMVVTVNGDSEIGARGKRNLSFCISVRQLMRSPIEFLFLRIDLFALMHEQHVLGLPSSVSTMFAPIKFAEKCFREELRNLSTQEIGRMAVQCTPKVPANNDSFAPWYIRWSLRTCCASM